MSEHPVTADVVVVGGGAIGLSVAWRAAGRGLTALVLERGRAGGGTSHYAAGMLAPIAEVTPGEEPLLELGLRSARLYPRFVAELVEAAGVGDIGYTPCGTLLVARDADEAEALERELALRRRSGCRWSACGHRRRAAASPAWPRRSGSPSMSPAITPWTPGCCCPPCPLR